MLHIRPIDCTENIIKFSKTYEFWHTEKVFHKPPFSGHSHKRPKIKIPKLLHLTSLGTLRFYL